MFGAPLVAAVWRATAMRLRAAPEARNKRQGWMLEFEGASWARAREESSRGRGTGVGRNMRVEWRACTIWESVEVGT